MPVKTRKTTRRSRRDAHRNRHAARSQPLSSLGIVDTTVRKTPTVSAIKRGIATANISSLRKAGTVSPRRQTVPPIAAKAQVTVTTDA